MLEDDCVAYPDLFRFCDVLLERYAEDERVAVVTGNSFQRGRRRGQASYHFSKYNHCWGWATWRRAWRHLARVAGVRRRGATDNRSPLWVGLQPSLITDTVEPNTRPPKNRVYP